MSVTVEDANIEDRIDDDDDNSDTPELENTPVAPKPVGEQGVKVILLDTPEQLIRHGKKIHREVKRKEWAQVPIDKMLEAFQEKYKEFGRSFPIVLRHIVQTKNFYEKVFRRYILLCKNHPTHSMAEFQERQAEYLVMVYREEHPHCSNRELALVKERHVTDLKKEEEYMKKIMEEVQEERKKTSEKYAIDRKAEILSLISRSVKDVPTDIEVELKTDVPAYMKPAETTEYEPEDDNLVLLPKSVKE